MCNTGGRAERGGPPHTVAQAEEMYRFRWAVEEHGEANDGVSSSAERLSGTDACDVERLMK